MRNKKDLFDYKIPQAQLTSFIAVDISKAAEYTVNDLERSGLTPDMMGAKPVQFGDANYSTQYYIPYFDLDGNHLSDNEGFIQMFRKRGTLTSKGQSEKKGKYDAPGKAKVADLATIPYLNPEIWELGGPVVAICEGEKKAVAFMHYAEVASIGIGGKDNWHQAGNQRDLHPWLEAALQKLDAKEVWVIPDGDVRKNDIAQSYGSFYSALEAKGYKVRMPLLPNYDDKLDDLIVGEWQFTDVRARVEALPDVESYVQSVQSLAGRYHLQTTQRQNGGLLVKPNDYNVSTLVRDHPMFSDLWYNEDSDRVYFDDKHIDDSLMQELVGQFQYRMSMSDCNYRVFARALHSVARRFKSRSPWRDYLDGLTWDGVPRLEQMFRTYCAAPDTEVVLEAGRKWLVGSVARVFDPGAKVDYMVITQGAQGVGKSRLPLELWGEHNVSEILGTNTGKDLIMVMQSGFVASFEEMAVMKSNDITHLKGLLTVQEDTYRKPYSEEATTRPRRFVCYGSVNDVQFLNADSSGYRRFVVVPIGSVQFQQLRADRDQLWAEAVANYRAGAPYSFVEAAVADGSQYVVNDEEAELIDEAAREDYAMLVAGEAKTGPSAAFGFLHVDRHGVQHYAFQMSKMRVHLDLRGYTKPWVRQSLGTLGYRYLKQVSAGRKHYKSVWTISLDDLKI